MKKTDGISKVLKVESIGVALAAVLTLACLSASKRMSAKGYKNNADEICQNAVIDSHKIADFKQEQQNMFSAGVIDSDEYLKNMEYINSSLGAFVIGASEADKQNYQKAKDMQNQKEGDARACEGVLTLSAVAGLCFAGAHAIEKKEQKDRLKNLKSQTQAEM